MVRDDECRRLLTAGLCGYLLAIATFILLKANQIDLFSEQSSSFYLQDSEEVEDQQANDKYYEYEKDEDEEMEKGHESTLEGAVCGIVLFLICLTILFEKIKKYMLNAADETLKPTVETLFGEMTVLGFVGAVAFILTQLGFFARLSRHFFNEEETLLELFEFVHYILFLIMVFFITSVLFLVRDAQRKEEEWRKMDRACRDPTYILKAYECFDNVERDEPATWLPFMYRRLISCLISKEDRFLHKLIVFDGLRKEFILERSAEKPFKPAENRVDENFNFGLYSSLSLGHTLEHVVEVYPVTWICFAIATIIAYFTLRVIPTDTGTLAWIWAAWCWVFFACESYFDFHILQILKAFSAPRIHANYEHERADSLLQNPLPAWCQVDLTTYMESRTLLLRTLMTQAPNHRDTLYWFERSGPKVYLIIMQFKLVFLSAYCSLLILTFFPFMKDYGIWNILIYCGVSIFPAVSLCLQNLESIANMSQACCLGDHRRPQVVSKVIREEKTEKIIRSLLVIEKMHRVANESLQGSQTSIGSSSSRSVDAVELEEVGRIFDAFDKSGDGAIQSSEFNELMDALGVPLSPQGLQAMVQQLDIDGDGEISREEFLTFYVANLSSSGQDNLKELGRFMFRLFDDDNSGDVTLSEFKAVLDALHVGFTIDEIGELVKELDEEGKGSVGEKEFIRLLEKHSHMFKDLALPELTVDMNLTLQERFFFCVVDRGFGVL